MIQIPATLRLCPLSYSYANSLTIQQTYSLVDQALYPKCGTTTLDLALACRAMSAESECNHLNVKVFIKERAVCRIEPPP